MNPLISIADIQKITGCDRCPSDEAMVSLGYVANVFGVENAFLSASAINWFDIETARCVIAGMLMPAVRRATDGTSNKHALDCVSATERWCGGDNFVDLESAFSAAFTARQTVNIIEQLVIDAAGCAAHSAFGAQTKRAGIAANYLVWSAAACERVEWGDLAASEAKRQGDQWSVADNMALAKRCIEVERERQRQDIIAAFPPVFKCQ